MGLPVRAAENRHRRRVVHDRLHHQSRPPTFGGRKKGGDQGIGRSRGGKSTKVHLVVDALGLPVAFTLTPGQKHDAPPAVDLLSSVGELHCVLADKAYDSNEIRALLQDQGCDPCIPGRSNRIRPVPYDAHLYKARAEVECTFNLLKQFRRFATRYEKTMRNYAAIVSLACVCCWLRI